MTHEPGEVRRLVEAIEALDAIEDDEKATAALSRALEAWPGYHARLRELRQQRVQSLRGQGRSWQEIADIIGDITPARAQQIGAGLRGSKRPKKGEEPTAAE